MGTKPALQKQNQKKKKETQNIIPERILGHIHYNTGNYQTTSTDKQIRVRKTSKNKKKTQNQKKMTILTTYILLTNNIEY